MKMIICVDDQNGMLFNKRRLSSDLILNQRILQLAKNNKLWMNAYTAQLFGQLDGKITVDEDFCRKAEEGEYCFFESQDANVFASCAEEIIVFRWNRRYPSDVKFSQDNLLTKKLIFTEEFNGNSHDKITQEVYR